MTTRLGSGAMFDGIARRYDLLNRISALGMDQRWRDRAVTALELDRQSSPRVLDVATGTGDLALAILARHPASTVVGIDPSAEMLAVGRDKRHRLGLDHRLTLECGDGQALPHADNSFTAATIAFGIRNVPDRGRALAELARVTRPGGRIAILELSEPRRGLTGAFARLYMHQVVPRLGALLSSAKEYHYLRRSITAFPPPDEFATTIAASGLDLCTINRLTFGVCILFVATPTPSEPA